jgi:hypothetical protein
MKTAATIEAQEERKKDEQDDRARTANSSPGSSKRVQDVMATLGSSSRGNSNRV